MSESLYNTNNVKTVREKILKEQDGKDLLTGLEIPSGQAVLDHNHKTQYVRGVLHRQTNAVLGKIENLWTRYLAYWYEDTLANFLRKCADYLERNDDIRYVHPGWLKRVTTDFKKLNVQKQRYVLENMHVTEVPSNAISRIKSFQSRLKTKKYSYEQVKKLIGEA